MGPAEFLEGAEVEALGGGEEARDELGGLAGEGVDGGFAAGDGGLEDGAFDAVVAAAAPIGADEGIDQEAFEGANGLELGIVIEREGFEFGGIFAGDHEGSGFGARYS